MIKVLAFNFTDNGVYGRSNKSIILACDCCFQYGAKVEAGANF